MESTLSDNDEPARLPHVSSELRESYLLVEAAGIVCALPLIGLREILRPLPLIAVSGVPDYVLGAAQVRGVPVPVVSLARLLEAANPMEAARWVVLNVGERQVVLAVAAVRGVMPVGQLRAADVPPLLQRMRPDAVEGMASLDNGLLLALKPAGILPPDVLAQLSAMDVFRP